MVLSSPTCRYIDSLDASLVPLVLAATGHRDLRPADLPQLRSAVADVLRLLRSGNTPIFLLTGLAEGADQLAAEVAWKEGCTLIAALPMPLEIYRKTMSGEAADNLDRLLSLCSFEVPPPTEDLVPTEIESNEEVRAECYDRLARMLAHHSQALIALWDGKSSQLRGGTARLVSYMQDGIPDKRGETTIGSGPVYHVQTPRQSGNASGPAFSTEMLTPGTNRKLYLRRWNVLLKDLGRFNALTEETPVGGSQDARLLGKYAEPLSPYLRRLECVYGRADTVSTRANRCRQCLLLGIIAAAVLATSSYAFQADLLPDSVLFWFALPLCVGIALLLHRCGRMLHVETEYLDARALAEALRVQFFWQLAGVHHAVEEYFLKEQRTDLNWVRAGLRNLWLLRCANPEQISSALDHRGTLTAWVHNQADWYRSKAKRQARSVHRRSRISHVALIVAVAWSILIPGGILLWARLHGLSTEELVQAYHTPYATFHFLLGLPLLLAGAYKLWTEQAGYEEQSREYGYMAEKFSSTARELEEHVGDADTFCHLLQQLGIEALEENGRWLMLHRERPLEVIGSP